MIEISRAKSERDRGRHPANATPCIVCGRPVKITPRTAWVHVHMGGSHIVTEEEAKGLDEAAGLGGWPVGADCLRTHPEVKPYVIREPEEKPGKE